MRQQNSVISTLKRIWYVFSTRRKFQVTILMVLMVSTSLVEVLNIGAIATFLAVLVSPEQVINSSTAAPFLHIIGVTEVGQILLPVSIIFAVITVATNGMRFAVLYLSARFCAALGAELSLQAYLRTLYQPYSVHVSRNTSATISGITTKMGAVIHAVNMSLNLIGSAMLLMAILIALLLVNPFVALSSFLGFGVIYLLIIKVTTKKLMGNGVAASKGATHVHKLLQEALGGIRDVLLDGLQPLYGRLFYKADHDSRRASSNVEIMKSAPRFGMETLGILLILVLAYYLTRNSSGVLGAVPILGALALGTQRMLPVFQSAYSSWSGIIGTKASIDESLDLLEQESGVHVEESEPLEALSFQDSIEFRDVHFRYEANSPWVLHGINLVIKKGSKIGFVGTTGSGKSTLLDLTMALLFTSKGDLMVDGQALSEKNYRSWQKRIAHVPQSIFLSDASILENIAFGVPRGKIDGAKVKAAASLACLAETVESWPLRYETQIGERGIRISGGQRQRIGIARALYKNADVIVLDEATSALDTLTERLVMRAFDRPQNSHHNPPTTLMIAHRLSTLEGCDQIIWIEKGEIKKIGSYQEIVLMQNEGA